MKRGGVSIYFKEIFSVRVIKIRYLKDVLLLEMNYNNKRVIVTVIYRSASQNNSEFHSFLRSVAETIEWFKKLNHFYLKLRMISMQERRIGDLKTLVPERD